MRRPTPQLDRFADLIAEGVSPQDAAARMGYANPRHGNSMVQRLRQMMGVQAV